MPLTIDLLVRALGLGVSLVLIVFLLVNQKPVIKLMDLSVPSRNYVQWHNAPELGLPEDKVESVGQFLLPLGDEEEEEVIGFIDVRVRV